MENKTKKSKIEEMLPKLNFLPQKYKDEIYKITDFRLGLEQSGIDKVERILFNYICKYLSDRQTEMPHGVRLNYNYESIDIYLGALDGSDSEFIARVQDVIFTDFSIGIYVKRSRLERRGEGAVFFEIEHLEELVSYISSLRFEDKETRELNDRIIQEIELALTNDHRDKGIFFESMGVSGAKTINIMHEYRLFPDMKVCSIPNLGKTHANLELLFSYGVPVDLRHTSNYSLIVEHVKNNVRRAVNIIFEVLAIAKLDGRPYKMIMLEGTLSVINPETKEVFIEVFPDNINYNGMTLFIDDIKLQDVARAKSKVIKGSQYFDTYN